MDRGQTSSCRLECLRPKDPDFELRRRIKGLTDKQKDHVEPRSVKAEHGMAKGRIPFVETGSRLPSVGKLSTDVGRREL